MSIVPAGSAVPAAGAEGAGFLALAARVTRLTASAIRLKESAWALQKHMERNAQAARRLSEMCTTAEVDPEYTEQILEVAAALMAVANASGQLFGDRRHHGRPRHRLQRGPRGEYRGIYEAVNASKHQQAKPGFYKVR